MAINRNDISDFLDKVVNDDNNQKWKHYKPMFKLFVVGYATKRQHFRIKQVYENGSSKYVNYPKMKRPGGDWQIIFPQTSFIEFVEQLERLGLLIDTGNDCARIDTELIKKFPEGNHLLKELR